MYYLFNPITKVFTRETEGQKDPLGGGFLKPAFSTTKKPPILTGIYKAKFVNDAWDTIQDYSNTDVFLKADASKITLEIGERLDDTMTLLTPVDKFPKWDVDKWVTDEVQLLAEAKTLKAQEIENDFNEAESIPVVFLGETYFGGHESASSIDGYVRLTRLAGLGAFKIWDVDGVEHLHTDTTVDALLLEIGVASSRNKFEKKDRKVALSKATTIAEVNAV